MSREIFEKTQFFSLLLLAVACVFSRFSFSLRLALVLLVLAFACRSLVSLLLVFPLVSSRCWLALAWFCVCFGARLLVLPVSARVLVVFAFVFVCFRLCFCSVSLAFVFAFFAFACCSLALVCFRSFCFGAGVSLCLLVFAFVLAGALLV